MFTDREDAGRRLAEVLRSRVLTGDTVVFGVPRGGVVVAAQVARVLGAPLDIVIASKLGAPGQPEYAVGAVDADGNVTVASGMRLPESYLQQEAAERTAEVRRRVAVYRGERPPIDLRGRTAILVDDGIATGLTIRQAAEYLWRHGAGHVIVAVPVVSWATAKTMRAEGVDLVAVEEPLDFAAVGQFYREFGQTTDAEVLALLSGSTGPASSPQSA